MNTKKRRRIEFMIGAVVLVLLGAYFAARTPQDKPREMISNGPTKTATIPIEGMTCASCIARVKQKLKSINGVSEVEVSLDQRNARVRYLDGKVLPEHLVAVINDLGYKAGTPTVERTR